MHDLWDAFLFSLLDESDASSHPGTLHLTYDNERRAAAKHWEQCGAGYN